MNWYTWITASLLILLTVHADAQEPLAAAEDSTPSVLELSLEDAVLLGLQHNRGLRMEQLNPVIAGAFEQIERAAFDPELFAGLGFSQESAQETSRSSGEKFAVEGRDSSAEIGVRQELPTGTELEASVGMDRSISNRAPEQQQLRYGLTVTQQLLRGLGSAVNFAAVRQAALDTRVSVYELRGYTEAFVAEIEITYWRYVAALESIAVFEKTLQVAATRLAQADARIEVGELSEFAVAAARAEFSEREQDLIDARSAQQVLRYQLIRMIYPGLPMPQLRELLAISSPPEQVGDSLPDASGSTSLALRSRPELKEAELRLERDELETVVTRNGRLPRLELFINLGKSGFADTFRESYRGSDGPSYDLAFGLEFSQALGSRAPRARDQIARSSLEQAREALANLQDLIRFDVFAALNELDRSQQQLQASGRTRLFRAQSLQAEADRFDVGSSNALNLVIAQRDYIESQIAEINARVDYQIARIELYRAEGSLLERRGISVQGF
ncbi:MAG: outer membrane protein [Lentimonas sp.]|jgi:outer membrane protein